MKKVICLALILIMSLSFASCSIPAKKPESGVWYCRELKTSIDFSLCQTTEYCAKLHNDDGTFEERGCYFDHSNGIILFEETDGETNEYLHGDFKYKEKEGQFVVTSYSDGKEYVFIEKADV